MDGFAYLAYGISGLCFVIGLKEVYRQLLPKFQQDKPYQHFFYALVFGLYLLWAAQASVKEGLSLHLLLTTTLTHILGWSLSIFVGVCVALLLLLTGQLSLEQLPAFLLLTVVVTVTVSYLLNRLVQNTLPKHLFVYLFVGVFISAAVVGSVHLSVNAFYQLYLGKHDWKTIVENYYVFAFLLAFPEALLNGLLMTLMVVYKPEWVRDYNDWDYVRSR